MSSSKQRLLSPWAEVAFPHLASPDTRFSAAGKYTACQVLDPGVPGHGQFLKNIEDIAKKLVGEKATLPIRDWKDKFGNANGEKLVKFSSSFAPKIYDRSNNPLVGKLIGAGSVIRVSATVNVYKGVGGRSGLSLYLNAIQVRELVEGFGSNPEAYGFVAEVAEAAPAAKGEGAAPEVPADFFKESDEAPF